MANQMAVSSVRSAEQQLALQLFSDIGQQNISIADSKTDVGFNISQVLVDVKDLSLLARKALIGCYFLAATSAKNAAGSYDYDLGFFKWLINYSSSNNLSHLKKVMTEAQRSAIQVNIIDADKPGKDKWASVPLMGTVVIQGGRIGFKLPTELISELANPDGIMMYLSLRIQANFTSLYAQTLFAKVVPVKAAGCTPWMSLPEFSKWMNIDQYDWAKEFRYLNRDVIKVAVDQINEYSDIVLTLEKKTARGTRQIEFVRFTIEPKTDTWANSVTVNGVVSEQQIYEVLTTEFAMSPRDIDKVIARRDVWTNPKLLDAIEYTRHRMQDSKQEYLRRPGNYFLKALEDGYRIVPPAKKLAEKADVKFEKECRENIQDREKKNDKAQGDEVQTIMKHFANLDDDVQNELWAKYSNSPAKTIIKSVEKKENDGKAMSRDVLLNAGRIRAGFAGVVQKYLDSI